VSEDGEGHAAERALQKATAAGVSPERLAALKLAIAEGRYRIDPEAIAEALLRDGVIPGE
jgi:anti-sigma28 factor (negative regulator of flagellin synthesis)